MKQCTGPCGEVKDLSMFNKSGKGAGGLRATCKICDSDYNKAHYQANKEEKAAYGKAYKTAFPEKVKATNKSWRDRHPMEMKALRLFYRYGLTQEQVNQRLLDQEGLCANLACNNLPTDTDHDHSCCPTTPTCGKCTRGILCHPCNTGHFGDSPEKLRGMADYYEKWVLDRQRAGMLE